MDQKPVNYHWKWSIVVLLMGITSSSSYEKITSSIKRVRERVYFWFDEGTWLPRCRCATVSSLPVRGVTTPSSLVSGPQRWRRSSHRCSPKMTSFTTASINRRRCVACTGNIRRSVSSRGSTSPYSQVASSFIGRFSGSILIFTGIRIKSTLNSRAPVEVQSLPTLQQASDNLGGDDEGDCDTGSIQNITTTATVATFLGGGAYRRRLNYGSRRTLRILVSTGIAYFLCWGPYVTTVFIQSFAPSVRPPAPIEFLLMWLANANSGVNVFIYSSTNLAFRRQCIAIVRRCCGRSDRQTA